MPMLLQVKIYENREHRYTSEFQGPVELGRQDHGEHGPFMRKRENGRWRLIIAAGNENAVGRHHVLLDPLPDGRVKVSNGTLQTPIKFLDRPDLPGKGSVEAALPLVMLLGTKTVRVQAVASTGLLQSLAGATAPPRSMAPANAGPSKMLSLVSGNGLDNRELLEWLHKVMDVLQAAADSADFFDRAAAAAVDMVELDSGRVLLLRDGNWEPVAVQRNRGMTADGLDEPSTWVLSMVLEDRKTYWQVPGGGTQSSLAGVEAVVAAPILDRHGEVIGAVYGDRRGRVPGMATSISEVEAMLVELLARGVAAGLARVEQEKAAIQARVQFEQFFTKELAGQLERHPDWLQGRNADVTVLFCDIRGFSRITEKLADPQQTVDLTRAVLDMLSDCVLSENGVLVDYLGDGLMALWGAPDRQEDHAERACRAALEMRSRLPGLNEKWRAVLGPIDASIQVGIGINTGTATVGNVGSLYKFKYGARGTVVNVASRVEGATKYWKTGVLITGPTEKGLGPDFRRRCLGKIKVVNIEQPVEVHELFPSDEPLWPAPKEEYESALRLYEEKEFTLSARLLGGWRAQQPNDAPALVLLYRAVRYLVEGIPPGHDHTVHEMEGK